MYLFLAESPNFSTIPLKIAPLFGGEAALKDARCGKSRDFRETFQWGQEAISLPWTIVKRLLYFFQEGIRHFVKVGPLRNVLPYKTVEILVGASFPGVIGPGKVESSFQMPGNLFMFCELQAIVGGYCLHQPYSCEVFQNVYQLVGCFFRRSFLESAQEANAGGTVYNRQDMLAVIRTYDGVYLNIPESAPLVHNDRPFGYVNTVLDNATALSGCSPLGVAAASLAQELVQASFVLLVPPDPPVECRGRPSLYHDGGNNPQSAPD